MVPSLSASHPFLAASKSFTIFPTNICATVTLVVPATFVSATAFAALVHVAMFAVIASREVAPPAISASSPSAAVAAAACSLILVDIPAIASIEVTAAFKFAFISSINVAA